jgi:transposase
MAKLLLPDELWELIQSLIPPHPPQPQGGRPFLDDRKVLTGIIFILKTGLPWEDLPQEMGCGCGMTCWNRLRDWQAAGIWDQIHQILLAHLRHADKIDFERFIVDTSHVRAVGGGEETGPSPVDRRKPGSKHAVLTDGQGVPLVVDTIPANTPDANQAVPLVDAVPPIGGKPGHPRKRPDKAMGDRGFDDGRNGRSCATEGSIPSWPSGVRPMAVAWVCIAGWWSERIVGFTSIADSVCVTIVVTTSIKGSVPWPKFSSPSSSWSCMA